MVSKHPAVLVLSQQLCIGVLDAEAVLRSRAAAGDADAAKVVREVDAGYAKIKADALALNNANAAKLGMTMDQVRDLAALLQNRQLWTWLCYRVNLHALHDRAPTHEE